MIDILNKDYPYPSRRNLTYAKNGMVASSQPLAVAAGLEILKKGGNAIDAAIATAACLTVVEPTSNGIGGDGFALVSWQGKLYGLNASGRAPKLFSRANLAAAGYREIPRFGLLPVTVPGVPSAWKELNQRFGKLTLLECLMPAIGYAKDGYPVSPEVARHWENAARIYRKNLSVPEFQPWKSTFTLNDKSPKEGDIWRLPDHAKTLEMIGKTEASTFYRGELADRIDLFSRRHGGFIRKEDLENHQADWVEPIAVNYRGFTVHELPPNGQGLIALEALAIAEGFRFETKESADTYHLQIEAMKLAFADGLSAIADPERMRYRPEDYLDRDYVASRRQLIGDVALDPVCGKPSASGTVYLATADKDGNMVSYIQSNYMGFGSGIVIPETGIALQNRGLNFSLDPSSPNSLTPGKRPYHTIVPGFLSREGTPVGPFGVMGGFMQPQGHMQVVMNTIDFHLNPQAALDAPRWQWVEGKTVLLEPAVPEAVKAALIERGHLIRTEPNLSTFGRGEIIWRDPETGVCVGGCEPRADGTIASY